jgi:hypothetical protein
MHSALQARIAPEIMVGVPYYFVERGDWDTIALCQAD